MPKNYTFIYCLVLLATVTVVCFFNVFNTNPAKRARAMPLQSKTTPNPNPKPKTKPNTNTKVTLKFTSTVSNTLLPGDVLLWSAPSGNVVQTVEKVFLRSPYTHVSVVVAVQHHLCNTRVLVLEAAREGVRIKRLDEMLPVALQQGERVVARRLLPVLDSTLQNVLFEAALAFSGAPYAFSAWKAIMYMWTPHLCLPLSNMSPTTRTRTRTRMHTYTASHSFWQKPRYCSELVALVYEVCGVWRLTQPADTLLPRHFSSDMSKWASAVFVSPFQLGPELFVYQ